MMSFIKRWLTSAADTIPTEFTGPVYLRDSEKLYLYEPQSDITTYEVAMLLPIFLNPFNNLNYVNYLTDNNLIRHFKLKEETDNE